MRAMIKLIARYDGDSLTECFGKEMIVLDSFGPDSVSSTDETINEELHNIVTDALAGIKGADWNHVGCVLDVTANWYKSGGYEYPEEWDYDIATDVILATPPSSWSEMRGWYEEYIGWDIHDDFGKRMERKHKRQMHQFTGGTVETPTNFFNGRIYPKSLFDPPGVK